MGILKRPSQNLCKPPNWCKIGAPIWRFKYEQQKKPQSGGIGAPDKNQRTTAGKQHQQHGRHSKSLQRNHSGIHGERVGCRAGGETQVQQVQLQKQGHGNQPKRSQQQDAAHQFWRYENIRFM